MNDYEKMKTLLNKGWNRYENPIETAKTKEIADDWRKDWETNYLLLCTSDDFLFVFDDEGNFKYITNSY